MDNHKDKCDGHHDEMDRWDLILSNLMVILLAVGFLVAGFVLYGMTN